MVTLARRPKPLSKPTNRIGVSKRMESSVTRRGGLPRAPRGLLLRRYRNLRRCDLSRTETLRTTRMGRRLIAIKRLRLTQPPLQRALVLRDLCSAVIARGLPVEQYRSCGDIRPVDRNDRTHEQRRMLPGTDAWSACHYSR